MPKYLTQTGGSFTEVSTVSTSAGASSASQIPALNASGLVDDTMLPREATGGSASASGKLPVLDSTGKIPSTMMPTGIAAETVSITASEALSAGDFVNIYNNSGTPAARKADASTSGKSAHGFVLAAVASGSAATIYLEGSNSQVTGQIAGNVFLSAATAGLATSAAPTGSGKVVQLIGVATSATSISFSPGIAIVLA